MSFPQTIENCGLKMETEDNTQSITVKMKDTTKGLILDYDLTTTPKQFSLTSAGVNFNDGTNNYTTGLSRLAAVQQAFQAVELPPDATTLKINNELLMSDGTNSGSIGLNGLNTEITASGDLIFNPTGSINANGKTLDMTGGEIHKVPLIHGTNNTDLIIEGKGTGDIILKTNNINRITVGDNGITTFSTLPECSTVPTTSNQLVNKAYADSITPPNPSLSNVLTTGNSAGSNSINMNNNNITGVNNLNMNVDTTSKSILLNDLTTANANGPYPYTSGVTSNSFQVGINKSTTNKITLATPAEIAFTELVNPNAPIVSASTLSVSTTELINSFTPSISVGSACSAIFSNNNKLIYTDNVNTKIFYLQNFVGSGFTTIDLSTLTTGADNYSARLSSIGIQQFYPISYTSATNCKFFIRMGENSANNNFYLVTCDGDPTLLTSYTYGIYYFIVNSVVLPNIISNGSPASFVNTTNGQVINGQRVYISYYDSVNNYFILGMQGSAIVNNYFTILTGNMLQYCAYVSPIPSGYTSSAFCFNNVTAGQNSWLKIYNNNVATSTGILIMWYWNEVTKTLFRSPDYNIGANTTGDFPNFGNCDGYLYAAGSSGLYLGLPYADNLTAPNANIYFGLYLWDKNIANAITLVRTILLESVTQQTFYTTTYYSCRMYNENYIEIVSPINDRMYISSNGFTTAVSYNTIGLKSTFTSYTNSEGDGVSQARYSIVYPQHYYMRGSALNTYNNSALVSVTNNASGSPVEYLNFSYNPSTSIANMSSTGNFIIDANPLTLIGDDLRFTLLPSIGTSSYNKVVSNATTGQIYKQTNFYAHSTKVTTQSLSANTNELVTFGSMITSNGITLAGSIFTFNTTGKFLINYGATFIQTATSYGAVYLRNPTNIVSNTIVVSNIAGNDSNTITGSFILDVTNSSSQIALGAFVSSASSLKSQSILTVTSNSAFISITQIE